MAQWQDEGMPPHFRRSADARRERHHERVNIEEGEALARRIAAALNSTASIPLTLLIRLEAPDLLAENAATTLRIKDLEDAIRNLHKVKGRHHTQQACERLFKLIGIENASL